MARSENFDPARIQSATENLFGIRMQLTEHDPFRLVVGEAWEIFRWFATEAERDEALAAMRSQHAYSRSGDKPTLIYDKIEAPAPTQTARG